MNIERTDGLLAWQWSLYQQGHQDRRNLLIHVCTQPLFVLGTVAIPSGLASGRFVFALAGVLAMIGAVAMQGRGHRLENNPPVAFRSRLDIVARIFAEQWITFPRYVLTGGFARAWTAAR